jgi:hypothetical protein
MAVASIFIPPEEVTKLDPRELAYFQGRVAAEILTNTQIHQMLERSLAPTMQKLRKP